MRTRVLEPEVMDDYDEAWAYDRMDHEAVNRQFVDDLLAGGSVGPRVVDLGTGNALIPIYLCERVEQLQVMGMDASVEMLDIAKRRIDMAGMLQRIQLVHGDVKELTLFPEAMTDTVISNTLLHHLPHPELAVDFAIRILMPGGRLFIRDLVRPDTDLEVQRLVALHGGTAEVGQRLLRDSFYASLRLDEAREIFVSRGYAAHQIEMTSDRHWTFDSAR